MNHLIHSLKNSLKNKEIYLNYINGLNYESNNILDGLFGKFFILNIKRDTYKNSVYDKKFILSKLNEITNS